MLFFVIERFRGGDSAAVHARFSREGRLLPDVVRYVASWIDPHGARCFQVMDAPDRASLDPWIARWSDLVEFEVVRVLESADYWAEFAGQPSDSPPRAEPAG
jgi:hypothetical protein